MSESIKDFLLARIAEDEAAAREEDDDFADTTLMPAYDSEHQAKWNTARVLAECAAKRAIIAAHPIVVQLWWDEQCEIEVCETCQEDSYPDQWPCDTIKALAAVYSDHADYNADWAL